MDWDETDDHDFSDSEVDYYMDEPRKTGGSKRHIHQHTHGKIFECRCKFHPGICQYQAGHSGYYCKLPVEVSPCGYRQKLRHA